MLKTKGWAIAYDLGKRSKGLYQGFWFTKKDAIEAHIKEIGGGWDYCIRK